MRMFLSRDLSSRPDLFLPPILYSVLLHDCHDVGSFGSDLQDIFALSIFVIVPEATPVLSDLFNGNLPLAIPFYIYGRCSSQKFGGMEWSPFDLRAYVVSICLSVPIDVLYGGLDLPEVFWHLHI